METTKLKPFDLEKAKAGVKVVTRDGHQVKIICWDRVDRTYPIVALIECPIDSGTVEEIATFTDQGAFYDDGTEHCHDLFMAPTIIEQWVNVYKCGCSYAYSYYGSEQEALKHKDRFSEYVATTRMAWEE